MMTLTPLMKAFITVFGGIYVMFQIGQLAKTGNPLYVLAAVWLSVIAIFGVWAFFKFFDDV